jgi:quinol monooxygenase YgiN
VGDELDLLFHEDRVSRIVELRQYTLKPGRRDALIDLFEREFVESQEAAGIDLIATFRDAGDPDRFVWLRGFPDMAARAKSLAAFYGGAVWKAHREAANATMVDSDNVLLLRPAGEGLDFARGMERAGRGATALPSECVVAAICSLAVPASGSLVDACREALPARCAAARAKLLAAFVSEPSANNFPALPVREGENVFAFFARFAEAPAMRAIALPPELQRALTRPAAILHLEPTARCARL